MFRSAQESERAVFFMSVEPAGKLKGNEGGEMAREQMTEHEVASYIGMDLRQLRKLASRGQIPCRRVGEEYVFRRGEVYDWIAHQMPQLQGAEWAQIEQGVGRHHGIDVEGMLVAPLIPPQGAVVPLLARSRESILRTLVDTAEAAGLVYNKDELLTEVRNREDLCSTALLPGVALPHPHFPLPYDISQSFVVVALAPSALPFGSQDGSLTRLFFLICCKDERTHLHVLARLARMLHERGAIDRLLEAQDAEDLLTQLTELEKAVL